MKASLLVRKIKTSGSGFLLLVWKKILVFLTNLNPNAIQSVICASEYIYIFFSFHLSQIQDIILYSPKKKQKKKPDFFLKLLSPSKGQWHPTPVLLPGKSHGWRSLRVGDAKSWTRLSNFTFTFHFHGLEKEMATYSSVLA